MRMRSNNAGACKSHPWFRGLNPCIAKQQGRISEDRMTALADKYKECPHRGPVLRKFDVQKEERGAGKGPSDR